MAQLDDPDHPHALILYREALLQLREAKEAKEAREAKAAERAVPAAAPTPAPPPDPASVGSPYLTAAEAAAYCRVAKKTIYNHRQDIDRAPGVGKLVFTREALDRWLATRPRRRGRR